MQVSKWVSGSGILVVLFFFFLPWVTVSCGNQQLFTFTGYELAAGTEINTGFTVEKTEGDTAVFIIPAAALVAGALLVLGLGGTLPMRGIAVGQLLTGAAGLLILWLKWSQMSQDVRAQGGDVSTEAGFWFTIVGLGLIILGGILAWLERPEGNYQDPYGYTGGYYQ